MINVIPANAGDLGDFRPGWIPACAGMAQKKSVSIRVPMTGTVPWC
jgi:hypothetical protein